MTIAVVEDTQRNVLAVAHPTRIVLPEERSSPSLAVVRGVSPAPQKVGDGYSKAPCVADRPSGVAPLVPPRDLQEPKRRS